MLSFKPITLKDKQWVDPIVMAENTRSSDFNFGNIYIWNKSYRQLITRFESRMITKLRYDKVPMFAFPIGDGDLESAIEAIREFAAFKGYPLVIRGITEENRQLLEAIYPEKFSYEEDKTYSDYIYPAEQLATYSGKALHGKKNHCNRFEADHQWRFVPLTRELIPACLDMLEHWIEENSERLDPSITKEHDALLRTFAAYELLKLDGGVLFADDQIVGFTIGEMTCEDCFDVHFEKAAAQMNGAYPMVCREFTRILMEKYPKLRYMNREDDMGLEALRTSKMSYRPEYLLKKYTAKWRYE